MDSIKIPDYLSQKFENIQPDLEENPHDQLTTLPDTEKSLYLEDLINYATWLTEAGDKAAKNNNLPGTGQISPDHLGELLGKYADKKLPEFVKEKVEDAGVVTLLGGILYMNYAAYKRNQAEALKEQKSEGVKDEN